MPESGSFVSQQEDNRAGDCRPPRDNALPLPAPVRVGMGAVARVGVGLAVPRKIPAVRLVGTVRGVQSVLRRLKRATRRLGAMSHPRGG